MLSHVIALAGCAASQIILLRVTPDQVLAAQHLHSPTYLTHQDERVIAHAEAQWYLQHVALDKFPAHLDVTCAICNGPPADSILAFAAPIQADLIALFTHLCAGISSLIHHSIAAEILERSHLPVLLVHPEER